MTVKLQHWRAFPAIFAWKGAPMLGFGFLGTSSNIVVPAKAGTQSILCQHEVDWIPASAGMTILTRLE